MALFHWYLKSFSVVLCCLLSMSLYMYAREQWARMGWYCVTHMASATAQYFSRKLKCSILDITVKSIKKAYRDVQRKQKYRGEDPKMTT